MDRTFEMFQNIERALITNKIYGIPIIYIKPDLDKSLISKLKEIVRKRNAQVAESEENATHICYDLVDPLEEEYGRPLFKRDKMVMMHWYYFPSSFDTWVNMESTIDNINMDSPSPHNGPWRVAFNWLLDSDQYNEWMPEEDYEVDELGRKKVHPLRMSVEDLMNPSSEDRNRYVFNIFG